MSRRREEPLVTRKDLEELIDGIKELEPYREFMKKRWIGMVMWWHARSVEARWKYFLLRAIIVAGGVLIPVLTTFSMSSDWQKYATVTIAVVGAIVAGCAAWEGVANYGETWREKRRAAELLKVEGWQFLQLCGKYQPDKEYKVAFPRFAAEVESMIAREVGEYLAVFDTSLVQAKNAAENLTNAIVEEARKRIGQP
jgi:signal transduction histidine kinase